MTTTQLKTLLYPLKEIIGFPIASFLLPSDGSVICSQINKILKTGKPEWATYSFKNYSYLALIDQVDPNVVAVHEVFDDPDNRKELKRKLWVASGNFHRELHKNKVESKK